MSKNRNCSFIKNIPISFNEFQFIKFYMPSVWTKNGMPVLFSMYLEKISSAQPNQNHSIITIHIGHLIELCNLLCLLVYTAKISVTMCHLYCNIYLQVCMTWIFSCTHSNMGETLWPKPCGASQKKWQIIEWLILPATETYGKVK